MMTKETRKMYRVLTKYIILAVALLMGGAATAQQSGVVVGGNVFGGGNKANVKGSSSVTVKQTGTDVNGLLPPTIEGDVYGGGALASVNVTATVDSETETTTYSQTPGTTTTVEITHGTINGNVYGGGLGDDTHAAAVYGEVTVNIGKLTDALEDGFAPSASVSGDATLNGSVFGCNNANGTPKDNVTVNIYKTAHTSGDDGNTVDGTGFAIHEVFGGGNQAHYVPATTGKMTTVHVWTCDNTIEYVYGGGNAADVGTLDADPEEAGNQTITANTSVIIDGGRIEWVFGGGNGAGNDNPGANIYGNVGVSYHAGKITYLFGGSNEKGDITGSKTVSVLNDGPCTGNQITELYGGSNLAPLNGNVSLTMLCHANANNCQIGTIFGGSRNANINGNVTLTIEGGLYNYAFGGNNIGGTIDGNVTLNLYGGTINEAAFGGNRGGGSIMGNITVNVEDQCDCLLHVKDVFGAGDQALYTAPTGEGAREFNPMVNVNNVVCNNNGNTITGNVYGGGNGNPEDSSQEPGMVTGNPKVTIGDVTTGNEDYIATISGNVYGGGNAAKVDGNTTVLVQQDNSIVNYDIFGGGNLADVTGSTTVNIEGGTVYSVYGGGALASTGPTTVNILAGTITGDVYGGCLGGPYNEIIYSPAVNGTTTVNIGSGTVDPDTGLSTSTSGSATFIGSSVYGGNDASGSPTGNATVNVYKTNHTTTNTYTYIEDDGVNGEPTYAIAGVFGGGNSADFLGPNTYVNIYGCDNTIERVFGGSNAASAKTVNTMIQGGRIGQVFGGGNGFIISSDEADIHGNVNLDIHGGIIREVYGGGNEVGTIEGTISLNVDKTSDCDMIIREVYSGGNVAGSAAGNITIGCTGDLVSGENGHAAHPENIGVTLEGIGTVYGGANQADIGSNENHSNIKVDINNGIVANVFGGNNNDGSIYGTITVNIEKTGSCDWYVGNVFGGGNLAPYTGSPAVNIKNGTVSGNVYGGGKGSSAVVTGAPQVTVGDLTSGHDDYEATVMGDVYGGGDAANVNIGTPEVLIQKCNTSVGYVYGGGNAANVPATSVTVTGGTISSSVFGGGHGDKDAEPALEANVTGNTSVTINGGTINKVFGGSNSKGTIGGSIGVVVDKNNTCDLHITEVYGGGNFAASNAGNITVNCTGTFTDWNNYEGIEYLYGGANQADVTGPITLNITQGTIENVFGGNNTSGTISNGITVNVTKADDCMHLYNVYGAGNLAAYSGSPAVNIKHGTVDNNVYGGGKGSTAIVTGDPVVTIGDNNSGHVAVVSGDVYGGGDAAAVTGATTVAYNDNNASSTVGNLFGGGNAAGVSSTATVTLTSGKVVSGIYGGCNSSGNIGGKITVNVNGGTVGALTDVGTLANVFGGGYGASTTTSGNVEVNVTNGTINGDVYGGSALGNVNAGSGNTTIVNVTGGTLNTIETTPGGFSIYNGGNVYGGGLGRKAVADDPATPDEDESQPAIEAKVYGTVTVNIGSYTPDSADPDQGDHTGNAYSGNATIQGNVYGCNNTNGSPQEDVTVNIYQTAHTTTDDVDYVEDDGVNGPPTFAINNVFGGGNEADFRVDEKTTTVNVFGCDNTIERTFGGGNAAATNSVITDIKGGRIHDVFGGGNGEVSAADIYGNITLGIHGGTIGQSYSISNQNGVVTGGASVVINNTGCGGVQVEDHFMGGNFADVEGDLDSEITCDGGMVVKNLYGGCKQANITGNVRLTVNGGTYENVYGGSKGTETTGANIGGNVVLNIYGGTITNAIYGGSHIKGSIGGTIIVNVEDKYPDDACALDVSIADVYGGGNQANYPGEGITHDGEYNYPEVNIKNATVKNVFGGAFEAEVTGNPQIKIKKGAKVLGNVYGGGNMGVVNGNPRVIVNGKDDTPNPTGD